MRPTLLSLPVLIGDAYASYSKNESRILSFRKCQRLNEPFSTLSTRTAMGSTASDGRPHPSQIQVSKGLTFLKSQGPSVVRLTSQNRLHAREYPMSHYPDLYLNGNCYLNDSTTLRFNFSRVPTVLPSPDSEPHLPVPCSCRCRQVLSRIHGNGLFHINPGRRRNLNTRLISQETRSRVS